MGAMLWHHEVPWQPNVATALRALQAEQFHRRYCFLDELDKWRRDAEEAMRAELDSGDRFGLAESYSEQLKTIEEIASQPVPQTPDDQIAALRQVLPDGFGDVLDVTDVNEIGGVHVMRVLKSAQVAQLLGTEQPILTTAKKSLHAIAGQIDRGESVAFAAYDEADNPAYWVFVGYTVD